MALWGFLLWSENKRNVYFCLSAIMLGFAIATKVLALESLFIFIILMVVVFFDKNKSMRTSVITQILLYMAIVLVIPMVWFLFSYINTGNPVYPFFTTLYPIHVAASTSFIQDIAMLFLFLDDPISPIYLITLPLLIFSFSKLSFQAKLIGYYSLIALVFWYVTPRKGGGRFILPYLPAWSLIVILVLGQVKKQQVLYKTVLISIFLIAVITIGYRGIANSRYIPVILGKESKDVFLTKHLNFSFGDFFSFLRPLPHSSRTLS
jgi:hypothetical protein